MKKSEKNNKLTLEEITDTICKLAKQNGYGSITAITFEHVRIANISKIELNLPVTLP